MNWADEIRDRLQPVSGDVPLTSAAVTTVVVAALLAVAITPVWRVLRLAVTLVHELGHAIVGMAVGRRFTGFVLRGDMSGHAVTVGPARGFGRVVSTWAGYPVPAVVGAGMAWLAGRGWAPAVIAAVFVVLVVALIRVRSALTLLVMVVALAGTGALWWWRDDLVQAQVLVGVGIVLVVGAWRHLGAVWSARDSASDPAVLASLTHVPKVVWNVSFVLVCALSTWLLVSQVHAALT